MTVAAGLAKAEPLTGIEDVSSQPMAVTLPWRHYPKWREAIEEVPCQWWAM
jgi:hypothetical protein